MFGQRFQISSMQVWCDVLTEWDVGIAGYTSLIAAHGDIFSIHFALAEKRPEELAKLDFQTVKLSWTYTPKIHSSINQIWYILMNIYI